MKTKYLTNRWFLLSFVIFYQKRCLLIKFYLKIFYTKFWQFQNQKPLFWGIKRVFFVGKKIQNENIWNKKISH